MRKWSQQVLHSANCVVPSQGQNCPKWYQMVEVNGEYKHSCYETFGWTVCNNVHLKSFCHAWWLAGQTWLVTQIHIYSNGFFGKLFSFFLQCGPDWRSSSLNQYQATELNASVQHLVCLFGYVIWVVSVNYYLVSLCLLLNIKKTCVVSCN